MATINERVEDIRKIAQDRKDSAVSISIRSSAAETLEMIRYYDSILTALTTEQARRERVEAVVTAAQGVAALIPWDGVTTEQSLAIIHLCDAVDALNEAAAIERTSMRHPQPAMRQSQARMAHREGEVLASSGDDQQ